MRRHLTVNRYCAGVFALAAAAVLLVSNQLSLGFIRAQPVTFGLLAAGVLFGELLPIQVRRRAGEEITLSTSFTFALLLVGGLAPALIAQGSASLVQGVVARKPPQRVLFNLAQYSLAIMAALLIIRLSDGGLATGTIRPFDSDDMPAILLGAGTFFTVNNGLVGVAIALHAGIPIGRFFRNDALLVLISGIVLLFMAPIVVAATAYSPAILPLFAAPILALFTAGRQAVRSEHEAHNDALTGLPNRAAFRGVVTDALGQESPQGCVLLMDLDRFKEVNDTLGHRYGDLLLQEVADRLQRHVAKKDHIARLGGDEFAIFSLERDRERARAFAQTVGDSLRTPFELEQIVVDVQASVGIALAPVDGADVDTLLQKADVAMYRAKETRSGVALYECSYDHHSPAKLALTADLRAAVDNDEIVVWYQPMRDLRSGEITAVEALVRWQHPDLGMLMPGSFINMAEHTNLIKPLTCKVLELALAQEAKWNALGMHVTVAVNVSARVLVEPQFASQVKNVLRRAGVSPSQLKLEVTESDLMADPVTARAVLSELKALGIEISIDDFGTGYSSLAHLTNLPVSEVKIDRSFVSKMEPTSQEEIIVSSTINLAHHLGLRAVAEGVEDAALLGRLKELHCDAAQGFGIAAAMSGPTATEWLRENGVKREPQALVHVA